MKKLLTVLMLAGVMIFSTASAQAQQKIGYINSTTIVEAMPEYKSMMTELEALSTKLNSQYESLAKAYLEDEQETAKNWESLSDIVKEYKQKELEEKAMKVQEFQSSAQEQISTREMELFQNLQSKAMAAVRQVASEEGYDYVFDITSGSLIVYPDGDDLTSKVILKL